MIERQPNRDLDAEYEAGRSFERRFGEKAAPMDGRGGEGRFAEPRSWVARTTDEVKAWFGDRDALRRRQWDEAAGDHTGQGPAVEMDEDSRITAELSTALASERNLDASNIKVAVRAGVVTLDGMVRISADRTLAEAAAWKIRGVVGVRNNLFVG
jgi:osmotically-inducible protein OsmY